MRDFLLTQSSRAAENRATSATVPSVPGVPAVSPSCKLSASLRLCSSALKTYLATAFALLLTLSANALPLAWRADWPDCKPVEKLLHRGTDVELQPTFYLNGIAADTNGWAFSTYVQTNCVGQWFGPLPGAFFSHSNDVGAASYGVMVRAEAPDGSVNYTAFARLRMLDSPGYTPGALPLPVPVLDFANVSVLNPPWPAAIASATNTLDQSVSSRLSSATNTLDQSWSSRLSQVSRDSTNYTDSATTLTPMGSYTEWTIRRDGEDVTDQVMSQPMYDSDVNSWSVVASVLPGEMTSGATEQPGPDALELAWTGDDTETLEPVATYTATRVRTDIIGYVLGSQANKVLAATNDLVKTQALTNYYTRAETDDAIDALAAYYITANAAGDAFASVAALTNATAYYSGGALRTPTRNDYAVVLADESHGGAEWRYIYAVHEGATTGQWEAQYPIETNDYEALSNKPSIDGIVLSGNKTSVDIGLQQLLNFDSSPEADSLNPVTSDGIKKALDAEAQNATNAAEYAVATADTSYPRFTSATNLNQSVQYLTVAPNNVLSIELPAGTAATKDWIVYAYFGAETALALPAANWWMADESYTNAIPASTPTAFYFSQVASNIFTISRQELKTITINQ